MAERLDPLAPGAGEPLTGLSYAHLVAGRPDQALRWAERAIAASPERPRPTTKPALRVVGRD